MASGSCRSNLMAAHLFLESRGINDVEKSYQLFTNAWLSPTSRYANVEIGWLKFLVKL